jgi:hypothetical protein
MPIWAFDCVSEEAVEIVAHVAAQVLQGCPSAVLHAMAAHKPSLAIFAKHHVVSGACIAWGLVTDQGAMLTNLVLLQCYARRPTNGHNRAALQMCLPTRSCGSTRIEIWMPRVADWGALPQFLSPPAARKTYACWMTRERCCRS